MHMLELIEKGEFVPGAFTAATLDLDDMHIG
jgi:hypothetical protein